MAAAIILGAWRVRHEMKLDALPMIANRFARHCAWPTFSVGHAGTDVKPVRDHGREKGALSLFAG